MSLITAIQTLIDFMFYQYFNLNNRILSLSSALQKLQELAPFISEDEYIAAKFHLETKS
jgi:hypothetical protein